MKLSQLYKQYKKVKKGIKKPTNKVQSKKTNIPRSKTGLWNKQLDRVIVPSNRITMKGPNGEKDFFKRPVLGKGLQTGKTVIMQPGKEYKFPGDKEVLETRMQKGGLSRRQIYQDVSAEVDRQTEALNTPEYKKLLQTEFYGPDSEQMPVQDMIDARRLNLDQLRVDVPYMSFMNFGPSTHAKYKPGDHSILLKKGKYNPSFFRHELSHSLDSSFTPGANKVGDYFTQVLSQDLNRPDNASNKNKEYEYLSDPSEVKARLKALRDSSIDQGYQLLQPGYDINTYKEGFSPGDKAQYQQLQDIGLSDDDINKYMYLFAKEDVAKQKIAQDGAEIPVEIDALYSRYQKDTKQYMQEGGSIKPYANILGLTPRGDLYYQAGLRTGPLNARVSGSANIPRAKNNFINPSLSMNAGPASVGFTPYGFNAAVGGGRAYVEGNADYSGDNISAQAGVFGNKFDLNADAYFDADRNFDGGINASYYLTPDLSLEASGRYSNFDGPMKDYYAGFRYQKNFQSGGSVTNDPPVAGDSSSLNNTRKFYEQWHASPRYKEMLRKSTHAMEPVEITKKLNLADKAGRFVRKTAPEIAKWYLGNDWPRIKKAAQEAQTQAVIDSQTVDILPIDTGLSYNQISSGRQQNLNSTPNTILPLTQQEIDAGYGGYSISKNGQIKSDPLYYTNPDPWYANFYHNELLPHELSHSTDRPLANSNERLIPQDDLDEIESRINPDANPDTIGFWEDYGDTPREGAINYFTTPSEVRARLNEIRYNLNKEGVDIFNNPVTQEDLDQLNTRSAVGDLQGVYRNEDILWLLNNISKIDNSKQPVYAQVGVQVGGETSTEENPERMNPIEINVQRRPWWKRTLRKIGVEVDPQYRDPNGFAGQMARRLADATGGENWYKTGNDIAGSFAQILTSPLTVPQLGMMYGLTGKVQTPSEAMDIQNPYGAFAVDAVLDPANIVGAGAVKAIGPSSLKNMVKSSPKGFIKGFKDRELYSLKAKDMLNSSQQPLKLEAPALYYRAAAKNKINKNLTEPINTVGKEWEKPENLNFFGTNLDRAKEYLDPAWTGSNDNTIIQSYMNYKKPYRVGENEVWTNKRINDLKGQGYDVIYVDPKNTRNIRDAREVIPLDKDIIQNAATVPGFPKYPVSSAKTTNPFQKFDDLASTNIEDSYHAAVGSPSYPDDITRAIDDWQEFNFVSPELQGAFDHSLQNDLILTRRLKTPLELGPDGRVLNTTNKPMSFAAGEGNPVFGDNRVFLMAPKGTKAAPISRAASSVARQRERELLFPADSKFKVVHTRNNPQTGSQDYIIELDQMQMGGMTVPGVNGTVVASSLYDKKKQYKSGGQHGGLDRWFAEKWVDVKTGKQCGRQEGENRAYPACRPSKRVSSKTPKTSSELSSKEKAKFKAAKTSSTRIPYNHKRKK